MKSESANDQTTTGLEFTPEGWATDDLPSFRLIMDHPPPRAYSYLTQLKIDALAWKPWAFWLGGVAFLVLAVIVKQWWLIVVGLFVLNAWFTMFRSVVRQMRDCPVAIGIVKALAPHPLLRGSATAQALVADGKEIPVVLSSPLAGVVRTWQGPVEVAILHTPQSQFSLVIGARPVPAG